MAYITRIRTVFFALITLAACSVQADVCYVDQALCEEKALLSQQLDALFVAAEDDELTAAEFAQLEIQLVNAQRLSDQLSTLGFGRAFDHHYTERSAHLLARTSVQGAQPLTVNDAVVTTNENTAALHADINLWLN